MSKASGGDGIPVELFQILEDDDVKWLHAICQQIWKTQHWPQDWKGKFSFQSQRKAMPKNAQTTAQLHSSHTLVTEKAMAPYSSTLAWKIPWMEKPGRLQSMGSLRVEHDRSTSLSLFTFLHWRRKWQPTPVSCLENPRDGGAWWAAVYGVAQSRTRLK